ncbi:MAG: TylF/MycF/NovP-related O-methyltransferase [Microcystaceae cyanobacterium]
MSQPIQVEGGLRTQAEQQEASKNKHCFDLNPSTWEKKIENFPKYVKRQNLTRFLALYEIFKRVVDVKGSIVECGVFQGFGILSWAKFSAILEPVNLTRRIYGFDSFEGFPAISEKDRSETSFHLQEGQLYADSYDEILELASIHDSTRFLGHIPKVKLIRGNATETIPRFIKDNPHLLVSLLFLDFDLYEPTKVAIEHFLPRMPKGAIIAFDELDNPLWPGETMALLETIGANRLRLERLPFDPYIGFAVVE